MSRGWIGVDLDGTLAEYTNWAGPTEIGKPIPLMLARVRAWLDAGKEVRIFTARVYPLGYLPGDLIPPADQHIFNYEQRVAFAAAHAIHVWCVEHLGRTLPLTCIKDYHMQELWDDRAVQVEKNTGRIATFISLPEDTTP
jgi:hypothetical protein